MENKFTLMYADIPSSNGVIYPREELQKAIAKAPKELLGQIGMTKTGIVEFTTASHITSNLELQEDGSVTGTIRILPTPMGDLAQQILEYGIFRPEMTGTVEYDATGFKTITNVTFRSFNLISAHDDTWPDRS